MTDPFRTDSIEVRDMPTGSHVFELVGDNNKRWGVHKGFVAFPATLSRVPTSITFTNVVLDGSANLRVLDISAKGFWFSVTTQGTGKKWGLTSVSFDWEAVI